MDNKYQNIEAYLVGLKKKIGLENKTSEVHTLILGSSHGQYSFIPKKGEYNLCLPSQDLYYSFSLYKKYSPILKNLKNVVLFYSVFSKGYNLVKTNEDFRCYHYEKIFGIKPNHSNYIEKLHKAYGSHDNYIDIKAEKLKISKFYRGENPDTTGKNVGRIGITDPVTRAIKAYKHHQRKPAQNKYILKILSIAQQKKHNLILVIPPAHIEYKKQLPPAEEVFADVFQIKKQHKKELTLLNFYQQYTFSDNEWWDYDHLNSNGAKRFTKIYHSLIDENIK